MTASPEEKRRRGHQFERVLNGMLAEAGLEPRTSFRPRGEEIDGSFVHRGRVMLLEAKWTSNPLPASSIYQFRGKVEGKLIGTIGVFISMSGFSEDAVSALVAGKVINTILFDGDDVRAIAANQVDVRTALDRKLRAAAEGGSPFIPLRDPTNDEPLAVSIWQRKSANARVVVVEGRFDALLVHALADEFGPSKYQLEVVPAGGVLNLATVANIARGAPDAASVIIIADGDGDPSAVYLNIERGLDHVGSRATPRTPIFVFEPTFEEALGVLHGFAEGRRRVLKLDNQLLRQRVRQANVLVAAESNPELKRLLAELGLTADRSPRQLDPGTVP
jgi:hypothetical protein